jgi:hypothetical protein
MQAFTSFSRARTVNVVAKESRIGMKPIPVPKGVTIKLQGQHLSVKASDELVTGRPQEPAAASCVLNCSNTDLNYLTEFVRRLLAADGISCCFVVLQGPKGELAWSFVPEVILKEVRVPRSLVRSQVSAVNWATGSLVAC